MEAAITVECSRLAGELEGLQGCINGDAVHLSPGSAVSMRSLVLDAHVDWLLEQPLSVQSHGAYHRELDQLRVRSLIGVCPPAARAVAGCPPPVRGADLVEGTGRPRGDVVALQPRVH